MFITHDRTVPKTFCRKRIENKMMLTRYLQIWCVLLLGANVLFSSLATDCYVDPAGQLTNTYAVEWNTEGSLESWTLSGVSATVSGGLLSGTTSSTTPQIIRSNFSGPDLDLGFNDYLEIRIQVPASHTGDIKISYGTTAKTGFKAARVLVIPDAAIPTDGAFHTYRLDVGPEPWWRATLRDLRIEPSATSGQAFAIDYLRVGDLAGDLYLVNTGWSSDNELSSKHFRFLWDANRAAQGVNSTTARGALRNAEEAWQVYVKVMGYREPAQSSYMPDGNKYKVNFLCNYNGYYMSSTWDGFAYFNIDPSGLVVDPPSWIIPHELMHVFQYHNNNGNYSGQWETHANYGRERWLHYYQAFYPNRSNIEALGVRDGHFMISSGRNYYLSWPFLYYVDDNPDNLPDLGDGMIKRLWQEGQSGEFWAATLDRITPTTSLKDISGYYARRCATWDFSNQAAMTAELNTQDPTRNARHCFTDLIERPDASGWWRVPPEKAPAQGAYAIHELVPAGSGAGRVVTVNLQGLPDAARGADWRASFIVVNDSGVERYTPLWSNGSSSVTLAANENKLYLSVAGTPDWYANGGFDESVEHFRSHPSRSRFHYQVQVTGATPLERNNGSTSGLTQHSNGGGWKSVSVPTSVYIGPNARVTGGSVSGNARIEDYAVVSGGTVNSSAVISGHAWVRGGTVTGYARVRDWGIVDGGTLSGNARVLEHATVEANMQDTAVAKGSALHQSGGTLSNNAIVDGDYMFNKSLSGGVTFGHLPYVGIPDNFTTATPAGLYAAYDFASVHDSRVLDQYGVIDGFSVGSPAWSLSDWKRKGFLSFNGSSQYIALDRSVADMHAFTFAAWVKPAGGTTNQAVLWLGASTTKRLCFTPDDGAGHAKFSIINGGAEQTLSASAALPINVWSHVAVALDGSTGTLFVNGSAVANGAITLVPDQLLAPNTTAGHQHNYLARAAGMAMPMFQGALDDVQFFSVALTTAQLAAVTVPVAGDVILADSFDSGNGSASSFNSTLAADQQGVLAQVSYRVTTGGQDWQAQHGNGGTMLLVGDAGYGSTASLNQDFSVPANGLDLPVSIQFDVWVSDTGVASCWSSFTIGSAQNIIVNNGAAKFGILPVQDGSMQVWVNGSAQSASHTGNSFRLLLSNTAGTGSAFNGAGSRVSLYNGATFVGSYTLPQLVPGDGYLTFAANPYNGAWNITHVDNLNISFVSNVSSSYLVSYAGNGNTGGGVPLDAGSPYADNARVTVHGNVSGLVRTGYMFARWNTAADGRGASYEPGDTFLISGPVTLYAQWTPGPDFIWNNGAATGLWNTNDLNWSGVSWVNSTVNNALFATVGGPVGLADAITAGSVTVGTTGLNVPNITFTNGSLAAASLMIQGRSDNNGAYVANPTLTLMVPTVSVAGDIAVGRANLVVAGGVVSANRIISSAASADWADVVIAGGTVIMTNGIDGSVNTGATFALDLNGGTLRTPFIKVADREEGTNNNAWLTFNGTLVHPTVNTNTFIALYGGKQNAYVGSGGADIDTDGFNIGIGVNLVAAGSGGLVKRGVGTLTLSGTNTYTGGTAISGGTLRIAHAQALPGAVTLVTGSTLEISVAGVSCGSLSGSGTLKVSGGMPLNVTGAMAAGTIAIEVANLESLNTRQSYTLVTAGATPSGTYTLVNGRFPWMLRVEGHSLVLRAQKATLLSIY